MPKSPPEILVVDDDPNYGRMLARTLQQRGHSVALARTGQEALARAQSRRPNLILLDIILPGMDGIALHRMLKSRHATRDIPVILITGMGAPGA
ncbi:MAG TPA: hypothetical protein DEB40_14600 [Elusimicrobia bacterium]|nr:hypothetical protein [Elusimicrobiota bacterium]HBT62964.1 hypothetical protein [Elusimicrobiota bacterium]